MLRRALALAVAGAATAGPASQGLGTLPAWPRTPRTVIVRAVDVSTTRYRFVPADVRVQLGDTVRWLQTATTPHNVEFKQIPSGANLGSQRVGPYLVAPGQTYQLVVDGRFAEGVYRYVCTPHAASGMVGTITVAGSSN